MQNWGVRAGLGLASLLLTYGFASLAIDSGSLLEYALTIGLLWYAIYNGIRAFRLALFS
jgi:hypothetical protein